MFVDRETFLAHAHAGGFLEWAEFVGNLYGTPVPDPPAGSDVVLEIDLQGAGQVLRRFPDAVLILLLAPSSAVQAERLRARGDDEGAIAERLRVGADEEVAGRAIAQHVVVNKDLGTTVEGVLGIIKHHRGLGGARPERQPGGTRAEETHG